MISRSSTSRRGVPSSDRCFKTIRLRSLFWTMLLAALVSCGTSRLVRWREYQAVLRRLEANNGAKFEFQGAGWPTFLTGNFGSTVCTLKTSPFVDSKGELRLNSSMSVATLPRFCNLATLDLGCCDTADLGALSRFPSVEHLRLGHVQGRDLTAVASCRRLQSLDLGGCSVSDISPLRDLKQLRTLRLRSTNVSDLSPLELEGLTRLQSLVVCNNVLPDLATVEPLTQANKLCEALPTSLLPLTGLRDLRFQRTRRRRRAGHSLLGPMRG